MAQDKRLLTMKDACQYLGVSRMTLIEAEERGLVTPERTVGGHRRYTVEALRELLKATQRRYEERDPPAPPQRELQLSQFVADLQGRTRAPERALKEALRNLVLLLQVEMGALYLRDEAGGLRLHAAFGIPHWSLDAMAAVGEDSISGEALRLRRPQVYDARAHHGLPAQLEIGQGLCVPLIYQDEALGCVHIVARSQRQFFPGEISIVTTIAVYLAALVVNTQLLDRVQALLGEIEARHAGAAPPRPAPAHGAVLDGLAAAVAAVDGAGAVTLWNRALEQLTAVPRERVLGAHPRAATPELDGLWAAVERTRADGVARVVALALPGGGRARFEVRPGPEAGGALVEAAPSRRGRPATAGLRLSCPRCQSRRVVKNGSARGGAPKWSCKDCRRQFVG